MIKLFKQLVSIQYEAAQTRKALRILAKQTWSVEFLTTLLQRAANHLRSPLEMTVGNGQQWIKVNVTPGKGFEEQDSIFNHLDNEVRIKQFMEQLK